ncbi:MAG: DUF2127 domain-containing protein [Chthoniobacterales bacterium]
MAIAIFKFVKGALLLPVTIGAVSLFHKDLGAHVENWINLLRIDPDNKYIGALLNRLNLVHTHELKQLSFLTGFYAALFLTEGTGLALRKTWAEYLTMVATALLIPLEIYEIWKHPSVMKAILIAGKCGGGAIPHLARAHQKAEQVKKRIHRQNFLSGTRPQIASSSKS